MIIWGWTGRTSVISKHHFHCPQCSRMRTGTLMQIRTWLTIFFIPILPLVNQGRHVQCTQCGGTFGEEVLTLDPNKEQQDRLLKMLRVMVMAALADRVVDDQERATINKQYSYLAGLPLGRQALDEEIQLAKASNNDLIGFIDQFAHELSDRGKALVVKLAYLVISASDNFEAGEQQLSRLPSTLGISEEQFMTLIESMEKGELAN